MKEYHKIQSVFLRDPATKHRTFLIGQYSEPAFEYLANNQWLFTEKVNGTNVRVHWSGEKVTFGGRTADAQMPLFLVYRLEQLFPMAKFAALFPYPEYTDVMLFGEGYGAKIQKGGGNYKPDGVDFVLFDVMIGGVYLERNNVEDVAAKLEIPVVPIVGRGTLNDAIEMTKGGFNSTWGLFMAEGLVMRPACELVDRRGHRVITKVKHRDFAEAK
jgi:ATP-dependent RNA circularization protein (DNA/RNA ligase family)